MEGKKRVVKEQWNDCVKHVKLFQCLFELIVF
jgi:uncharacterized protein YlzI (FlbEa/FlbD family)